MHNNTDRPDSRMALNRRTVLAGMAGLAAIRPGGAAAEDLPVARGALANNPLALAFESAPASLPDVPLMGVNGTHAVTSLLGRTLIMPLWAEWCAPCMGELPDFARLQQKYGNAKFAIVPILTGAQKRVTPDILNEIFGALHASIFQPLVENNFGSKLMDVMARRGRMVEIPCNLLIAPDGRVVGREFGLKSKEGKGDDDATPDPAKPDLIKLAEAGASLSLWGKAPGEEFAAAMANGFLA